ncbi:hypothetical protein ACPV5A_03750 [Vibrio chagasii]|uniref:hypothetical protein n=1 Tax=Vibrio chagasii TaxID=170679 RepID=UPI004068E130
MLLGSCISVLVLASLMLYKVSLIFCWLVGLLACWHRLAGFFTSLWATLLAYKMFIGYLTSCIAFLLGFAINSSRVMFISTQLIRFFTSTLMVQMLIEVCVKGMLDLGVNGDWLFDLPLTNTYPYGSLISFFLLWAGTNCLTLYTLKRKRSGNADYLKVEDKN